MHLLLPLAVESGTCIITNMGASETLINEVRKFLLGEPYHLSDCSIQFFLPVDPPGAQAKVIEIASSLGLSVSVAVAHEISLTNIGT